MKNNFKGFALIWVIIAGALLITGVGVAVSRREASKIEEPPPLPSPSPTPSISPPDAFNQLKQGDQAAKDIDKDIQEMIDQQNSQYEKNLLKILPPKERAELEDAIRQTQEVLKDIQPFNPSDIIDTDKILKALDQINNKAREQMKR